jgi:Transglycosylase-like domain
MKFRPIITALAVLAGALTIPAAAHADAPICHNGVLSDDAGMNCADGLYAAAHGTTSTSSDPICTNGILSDDAGRNCPDGLYERTYGSGAAGATSSPAATAAARAPLSSGGAAVSSGGYGVPPESIAICESGGNPTTNTGNGFYGKWQFTLATWRSVTGLPGLPSDYSEAVQDAAAAKLYAGGAGAGNWPVCSRR